jgi:hypothetical protein
MSVRLLFVGALALVGAGCCSLSSDVSQWKIDVTAPVENERVTFCPAILDENTDGAVASYDGTFALPENVATSVTDNNDDVYAFATAFSAVGSGVVPATLVQLMNTPMTFDMGPIGSVYDNNDPVTVTYTGTRAQTDPAAAPLTLKRTLVGGARASDTSVELTYEYEPSCETLEVNAVIDGVTEPRSCACETTSLTFEFTGAVL